MGGAPLYSENELSALPTDSLGLKAGRPDRPLKYLAGALSNSETNADVVNPSQKPFYWEFRPANGAKCSSGTTHA